MEDVQLADVSDQWVTLSVLGQDAAQFKLSPSSLPGAIRPRRFLFCPVLISGCLPVIWPLPGSGLSQRGPRRWQMTTGRLCALKPACRRGAMS